MAQQVLPGGIAIPAHLISTGFAFTSNLMLDASTERAAFLFTSPKTGTIDQVEFRVGTVSINASSVVRVSLQDISTADGNPDGTQDQYRDVAGSAISSNAWIAPGLMTDDGTNGGVKRSVTVGDRLAVVIEYQTFTAADSVIVSGWGVVSTNQSPMGFPYASLYTGSWAAQAGAPNMALKYDDGVYYPVAPHVTSFKTINTTLFNSSSTPDERGLKFSVPFPCVVRGAVFQCAFSGAARDITVKLYDSDGTTVLASSACDGDIRSSISTRTFFIPFADVELSPNTSYRLTVLPTTTSSVAMYDADVETAGHLNAVEGGAAWHHTQRTDAGSWTDTTTKRPFIGLWVAGFDDGAGGGGGGGPLIGGRLIR